MITTPVAANLSHLEARFEKMRLAFLDLSNQLAQLQSQLANLQLGQYQGGSGAASVVYLYAGGSSIGATSTISGATVQTYSGGILSTYTTSGVIYNPYASATTAGKVLTLGPNSDGTFTVLAQSC